jgi:transcriptional regulator with PAS, ATPase and Fis domain
MDSIESMLQRCAERLVKEGIHLEAAEFMFRHAMIDSALDVENSNMSHACVRLGIHRNTISRIVHDHNKKGTA